MDWLLLILAGVAEIGWVIGLKYSNSFTAFWPSILTAAAMIISMILISYAVKTIPIGTAYIVWVGIGAVGTAIIGIILFDEPVTLLRLGCIFLALLGIAGLSIFTVKA
jgi:quaternary ammonium compound-resistance protein SugE